MKRINFWEQRQDQESPNFPNSFSYLAVVTTAMNSLSATARPGDSAAQTTATEPPSTTQTFLLTSTSSPPATIVRQTPPTTTTSYKVKYHGLPPATTASIGIRTLTLILIVAGMIFVICGRHRKCPSINATNLPAEKNGISISRLPYESGGTAIYEMEDTFEVFSKTATNPVHELSNKSSSNPTIHELNAGPMSQKQRPKLAQSPIPAFERRKPVPANASFPAPRQNNEEPFPIPGSQSTIEQLVSSDAELAELEIARVRMQKERLENLQVLDAREEELRKKVEERRRTGSSPGIS